MRTRGVWRNSITAAAAVAIVHGVAPASAAQLQSASGGHRVQVGEASWYGAHHQGRRTASGELYDPQSLTAAHPSLPLGSTVRVTNLKNGRSVEVRVNDRGPFKSHRVIDVSTRAAEEIGIKRRGIGRVKVEPIAPRPQPAVFLYPG